MHTAQCTSVVNVIIVALMQLRALRFLQPGRAALIVRMIKVMHLMCLSESTYSTLAQAKQKLGFPEIFASCTTYLFCFSTLSMHFDATRDAAIALAACTSPPKRCTKLSLSYFTKLH